LPVLVAGSLLMHVNSDDRVRRFTCAAGVAALVLLLLQLPEARAADLLGLYLGGAFGQARVDASLPNVEQFREDHSAFKIMAGLRPIPMLGAELEYVDFGHPDRANFNCPTCLLIVAFPPLRRTNTSWAGGAGVQYKLRAFGVRGEYERFNAAGGNPYLLSLGATWTF
jgi:hypothetical protein